MPADWQQRDHIRPHDANRSSIEVEIAAIAGRQKQLVALPQLVALGLGKRGVSHRAQRRRLFRLHEGIYALHPPPYSPHQRYLAAVYACGRGSAISDLAGAWLQGMSEDRPAVTQISNATGNGRTLAGIVVHQRQIDRCDIELRYGIPCTTAARTILDCAASVPIKTLEELLMAADSGRPGLDRRRLEQLVAAHRGRRGIANLRELISDDPKDTEVENERRMLRICRRFAIPEPETQYPIETAGRRFRADFCWPELKLIVECDSWRWHGGKLKAESDRDRDQLLVIAGWVVVHFTRNQIKLEPERTGRKLAALIERRVAAEGPHASR